MTMRTTFAGLATAFVLGAGALLGGSLATSTSAEAAPGWHGKGGRHGHVGRGHGGRHWGHHHFRPHGWGYYRPAYYGGCYTVLRPRFVPGYGIVERPVTRCR
jgi:hypothetical protein